MKVVNIKVVMRQKESMEGLKGEDNGCIQPIGLMSMGVTIWVGLISQGLL